MVAAQSGWASGNTPRFANNMNAAKAKAVASSSALPRGCFSSVIGAHRIPPAPPMSNAILALALFTAVRRRYVRASFSGETI